MAGAYETWMRGPGFGPNWMHDPVGNAYWGVVGAMIDQQVARMKLGLCARYPANALAAGMSDALDLQGNDRLLPRGGSTPGASDESDASYAIRLQQAWETWTQAGTPLGLLRALKIAGFPVVATGTGTGTIIVNHIGRVYRLDDSDNLQVQSVGTCINRMNLQGEIPMLKLNGFTLDVRDQFFSHFMILFLETVADLDNSEGNPVKARLNRTVATWRSGGAIYNGAAIVPPGGGVWGWPPADVWGAEGDVWGSDGATFIDPN